MPAILRKWPEAAETGPIEKKSLGDYMSKIVQAI